MLLLIWRNVPLVLIFLTVNNLIIILPLGLHQINFRRRQSLFINIDNLLFIKIDNLLFRFRRIILTIYYTLRIY